MIPVLSPRRLDRVAEVPAEQPGWYLPRDPFGRATVRPGFGGQSDGGI